jgi:hypothetical protein
LEPVSGEKPLAREGTICFYARQYKFSVSDTRMKLFLYLLPSMKFLLAKKYLSIKGVFSVENRILDNVGMSLPSA